ncbi:MAG: patatin family protein [Clostridia bacterium]|nr:patatin family protein [Clostridia bacterium]
MKTGLVLEGGGFRGIYTAGVLDVFMENGISFEGVIGVSAGAIHGCSYLSAQKGRSIDYYTKYCNDWRFMSIKSFIKTGNVVGVDFAYHELPEKLVPYDYKAFDNCGVPFYVTVTNLETGKPEYIKINDMLADIDYLRASASLPYFSQIVEINSNKYLDGGCADSIPIKAFQNMGYKRNVIVLTRHDGYVKKQEHGIFAKLLYRKYPEFVKTLLGLQDRYNQTLEYIKALEKNGEIFVIRPSVPLTIGRMEHDSVRVREVYDIGASDARREMQKLNDWLAKA